MIDASTVRRMQSTWAGELHMKLCAKIEQAVVNAAMDNRTELLVQLHTAMQLAPHAHPSSIRLEDYAYDIKLLQVVLEVAGFKVDTATYADSLIIKW